MIQWSELLCKVTGKPFYPLRRDGAIVCSECGEIFIRDPPKPLGLTMPMKCHVTKREFYPLKSVEGGRVVIRCSECHRVIYKSKK
jgi:formylmethanofuran dehydrogenase subunit E